MNKYFESLGNDLVFATEVKDSFKEKIASVYKLFGLVLSEDFLDIPKYNEKTHFKDIGLSYLLAHEHRNYVPNHAKELTIMYIYKSYKSGLGVASCVPMRIAFNWITDGMFCILVYYADVDVVDRVFLSVDKEDAANNTFYSDYVEPLSMTLGGLLKDRLKKEESEK